MLRTSLRSVTRKGLALLHKFLSSNAQDFIEETSESSKPKPKTKFLSSNAQDFIEDVGGAAGAVAGADS